MHGNGSTIESVNLMNCKTTVRISVRVRDKMNHVKVRVDSAVFAKAQILEIRGDAVQEVHADKLVEFLEARFLEGICCLDWRLSEMRASVVVSDTPKQHDSFQKQQKGVGVSGWMSYEDILCGKILWVTIPS